MNANASVTATRHIAADSARHVRPGTEVDFVTAPAGPEAIDTPLDVALSGIEVGRMVLRSRDDYDAFVVGAGDDPGLGIARQLTTKPVVGIAEAGMLYASVLGARFSIITSLRCEITKTHELVAHYGLTSRLASVIALEDESNELASATLINDPAALVDVFEQRAAPAIGRDLAEVIVLIGSVMCSVAEPLGVRLGVPVVSGMVAAIKFAESLGDLGLETSHAYTYATPVKGDRLIGWTEFSDVYGRGSGER
jgi:allantoin racemase